jgi:hypothetical protein
MAKFLYDDGESKAVMELDAVDLMPAMKELDERATRETGVDNPYRLVGVELDGVTAHFEPISGVGPYVKLTAM